MRRMLREGFMSQWTGLTQGWRLSPADRQHCSSDGFRAVVQARINLGADQQGAGADAADGTGKAPSGNLQGSQGSYATSRADFPRSRRADLVQFAADCTVSAPRILDLATQTAHLGPYGSLEGPKHRRSTPAQPPLSDDDDDDCAGPLSINAIRTTRRKRESDIPFLYTRPPSPPRIPYFSTLGETFDAVKPSAYVKDNDPVPSRPQFVHSSAATTRTRKPNLETKACGGLSLGQ
ncbi:uncharacterized protein BDZ83DRAFT_649216 [Colletotrichum acutatum]|uniref:Uncharacterized protein n=1 Tax=Glomerella acutata TaxID=27357 RepID=A0AAD8UWY1_GLOAC|nr:uncharacterized protein BDZ83DRAFT_649216 [Colletotrichum acutatum]KAK1727855.1 hypothetical protein BDZ83DRAFT_649216 [Colletotrichum acutatum]